MSRPPEQVEKQLHQPLPVQGLHQVGLQRHQPPRRDGRPVPGLLQLRLREARQGAAEGPEEGGREHLYPAHGRDSRRVQVRVCLDVLSRSKLVPTSS